MLDQPFLNRTFALNSDTAVPKIVIAIWIDSTLDKDSGQSKSVELTSSIFYRITLKKVYFCLGMLRVIKMLSVVITIQILCYPHVNKETNPFQNEASYSHISFPCYKTLCD